MTQHFHLGYRPALDGLRAIAMFVVLLHHAYALPGGFIGVDIFFVLSGFLITALLVAEHDRSGGVDLKKFYARRFLRLAPALAAMLAVVLLWSVIFQSSTETQEQIVDTLLSITYVSNWTRAFDVFRTDLLGHTWSLSIEEQFYMLWPGIFLVAMKFARHRRTVAFVALGLAAASFATRFVLQFTGAPQYRVYNGLDTRADALMIGCALGLILGSGLLSERTLRRLQSRARVASPLCAVGLLVILVIGDSSGPWMFYWGFLLVELFAVTLVFDLIMNPTSALAAALRTRWLVRVGVLSYGLYLWHDPIFRIMRHHGAGHFTVLFVGTTAAFAFALLSRRLVEQPALRFKERFSTRPPDATADAEPDLVATSV